MEILRSSSLGPLDDCEMPTEALQNAAIATSSLEKYINRTGNNNNQPVHLSMAVLCV